MIFAMCYMLGNLWNNLKSSHIGITRVLIHIRMHIYIYVCMSRHVYGFVKCFKLCQVSLWSSWKTLNGLNWGIIISILLECVNLTFSPMLHYWDKGNRMFHRLSVHQDQVIWAANEALEGLTLLPHAWLFSLSHLLKIKELPCPLLSFCPLESVHQQRQVNHLPLVFVHSSDLSCPPDLNHLFSSCQQPIAGTPDPAERWLQTSNLMEFGNKLIQILNPNFKKSFIFTRLLIKNNLDSLVLPVLLVIATLFPFYILRFSLILFSMVRISPSWKHMWPSLIPLAFAHLLLSAHCFSAHLPLASSACSVRANGWAIIAGPGWDKAFCGFQHLLIPEVNMARSSLFSLWPPCLHVILPDAGS